MDSLQARLQFIQILKNLQKSLNQTRETTPPLPASVGNASDPVQFYIKHYKQHYEDFHQCLLDTTLRMDPLDRLNVAIYYLRLVNALYERAAQADSNDIEHVVVFEYLLASIDKIMDMAVPSEQWMALANLSECIFIFSFLNTLCGDVIPAKDVDSDLILSQDEENDNVQDMDTLDIRTILWYTPPTEQDKKHYRKSFEDAFTLLKDRLSKQKIMFAKFKTSGLCGIETSTESDNKSSAVISTNTQTILHRMENDRERHKRSKEQLWFTERLTALDESEFKNLWENTSDKLTKNDYANMKTLQDIAKQSYEVKL